MAKQQMTVRLSDDLTTALDTLAKEQVRDRSNTIEFILTSWVREHRPELLTDKPPKKTFIDYEK